MVPNEWHELRIIRTPPPPTGGIAGSLVRLASSPRSVADLLQSRCRQDPLPPAPRFFLGRDTNSQQTAGFRFHSHLCPCGLSCTLIMLIYFVKCPDIFKVKNVLVILQLIRSYIRSIWPATIWRATERTTLTSPPRRYTWARSRNSGTGAHSLLSLNLQFFISFLKGVWHESIGLSFFAWGLFLTSRV